MAPPVAQIGRLECELANSALAVTYSTYLGNAISLRTPADDIEWLGPRSEEFRFEADGRAMSLLEVGYVEWVDDVGPLGVVLKQRRTGNGFYLTIEDVALSGVGALLRRVHLSNLSHGVLHVARATPLAWTLRGRTEVREDAPGAVVSRSAAERGLFLAGEGLVPEAVPGELDVGRLVCPETRALAPGETWRMPLLWVTPFEGSVGEAWFKLNGRMREAARQWEQWDAEREALRRSRD